jgi:5-methylcytosine-specific restriction endonuclease McrA
MLRHIREFLPQAVSRDYSRECKVPIPEELRWEIFERDNFTCQRCGVHRMLRADHVIPESKGGLTIMKNLQTLCNICNSKKGAK